MIECQSSGSGSDIEKKQCKPFDFFDTRRSDTCRPGACFLNFSSDEDFTLIYDEGVGEGGIMWPICLAFVSLCNKKILYARF